VCRRRSFVSVLGNRCLRAATATCLAGWVARRGFPVICLYWYVADLRKLFSTTASMLLSAEVSVTLTAVAVYFRSLPEIQPSQYHAVIHGWDSTGGRTPIGHQPTGNAPRYARVLSVQQWISAKGVDEEGSPIEVLTELANGFLYCGYFCQSTNMVTAWDL